MKCCNASSIPRRCTPFPALTWWPRPWWTGLSPACTVRPTSASRQEFAEYRAYTEGDDLRHVDWNVFARTEKCFLKRYRGETNTQLLLLLDTQQLHGVRLAPGHQARLRPLRRGLALLHGQRAARRRRPDRVRRRGDELRGAFHAPGPAFPAAARHRKSRTRARAPISPSRSCIFRTFCTAAASWW